MKPGDLVIHQFDHPGSERTWKIGDTALIISDFTYATRRSHPNRHVFEILVNGHIDYVYDYEVAVIDHEKG
jgi:hypothetical protein